jgi:hypothetical protein
MRQMKNEATGTTINVVGFFMTRNFWEYYVTDNKFSEDVVRCLVLGFETELGDVSLSEVTPHVVCGTKDLQSVMPAPGWKWVD